MSPIYMYVSVMDVSVNVRDECLFYIYNPADLVS